MIEKQNSPGETALFVAVLDLATERGCAAGCLPIPDTEPPRFVAFGESAQLLALVRGISAPLVGVALGPHYDKCPQCDGPHTLDHCPNWRSATQEQTKPSDISMRLYKAAPGHFEETLMLDAAKEIDRLAAQLRASPAPAGSSSAAHAVVALTFRRDGTIGGHASLDEACIETRTTSLRDATKHHPWADKDGIIQTPASGFVRIKGRPDGSVDYMLDEKVVYTQPPGEHPYIKSSYRQQSSNAARSELWEAAKSHIDSLDAYDGDLVPINRTRGTAAELRAALAAPVSTGAGQSYGAVDAKRVALKPCPFCGSEAAADAARYRLLRDDGVPDVYVWDQRGEKYQESGDFLKGAELDAVLGAAIQAAPAAPIAEGVGLENIRKWTMGVEAPDSAWGEGYEAARRWVGMQLQCAHPAAVKESLTGGTCKGGLQVGEIDDKGSEP